MLSTFEAHPARPGRMLLLLLLLGSVSPGAAETTPDLLSLCEKARRSDPVFRQFQARLDAARQDRPQAAAALLPKIALSGHAEFQHQDIESDLPFSGGPNSSSYESYGYTLSLRQPIYRRELHLRLRRAGHTLSEAEHLLEDADQKLIVRVAEHYFNILAAEDNLVFARKEMQALSRQLEQAEQRFKVGLSAVTDVHETQAAHDRAVAAELQARNQLDRVREALREVTGELTLRLTPLPLELLLESPQPDDIEHWAALGLQSNKVILAAREAAAAALLDTEIAAADHLPSLDFLSKKSFQVSGGLFGSNETDGILLGMEFNLPLFQGGAVRAAVRRAHENYRIALEQLDQMRREVELRTREAYLALISGIGVVRALQRSVLSAETALKATRAGFEVGTRTPVDVISAERNLFEAQRNHARARYDYFLNHLRLRQASGLLSQNELERLNGWL